MAKEISYLAIHMRNKRRSFSDSRDNLQTSTGDLFLSGCIESELKTDSVRRVRRRK